MSDPVRWRSADSAAYDLARRKYVYLDATTWRPIEGRQRRSGGKLVEVRGLPVIGVWLGKNGEECSGPFADDAVGSEVARAHPGGDHQLPDCRPQQRSTGL